MKNSIPQNPDIVGVGGVFNYALVKTLAESNPDATALLVVRAKDGMDGAERARHLFDKKIKTSDDKNLITLPENVLPVDLGNFLRNFRGKVRDTLFPILPSNSLRSGLIDIRNNVGKQAFEDCVIVSATKGMENSTLKLPHEIIEEVLDVRERVIVLLGGNLAFDLARGMPMITELAGESESVARVANFFGKSKLRIYCSMDKRVLDIAGSVKNVHSFAAGTASVFGESTTATVATRGLAEYERIAAKIGDCAENQIPKNQGVASDYNLFQATRNFAAGKKFIELLKSGISVQNTLAQITQNKTIEGVASAIPLRDFVARLKIQAPLIEAIAAILEEKISVRKAAASLIVSGREANF